MNPTFESIYLSSLGWKT